VLQVAVKTKLSFDIGPKWANSVLPDAVPNPAIVNSIEDLPLTVVLGCDFCAPDGTFKQHITFRTEQGRTELVQFDFTPQARKDGAGYQEELHLVVIDGGAGRELDRLTIPVTVKASPAAGAPAGINRSLAFRVSRSRPSAGPTPDVIIYAIEDSGPSVRFSIEPVSPAMVTLLGPLALDGGKPRTFRSAVLDAEHVDHASAWSFDALSAISLQETGLAKLRATGVSTVISDEARENLLFSASEASSVAEVIAATGQQLYGAFFYGGDPILTQLITLLEQAASTNDEPLRVKIVTDRLSLPWQYLHPVGPVIDPKQFWGMRFSLSVLRTNDGARSWRESAAAAPAAHTVLFAHYGTDTDPSVDLARAQIDKLRLALPSMTVEPVYTGKDLMKRLRDSKDAIAGFLTFMHATSGGQNGTPTLEFGDADKVDSMDFAVLKNKVPAADQDLRYLSQGPLAVLNACETGPALKRSQSKLPTSLFKLGVRGVVVTEVSVWQTLGDAVAQRLFARLAKGEAAADALTAVRRELLAEKNNPLGLLYAYYGDPAATLLPQETR
jgi:hypothetical protein